MKLALYRSYHIALFFPQFQENPYFYTILNSNPSFWEATPEPTEGAASMIHPASVAVQILIVYLSLMFAALRL